jgi:formate C-acetyltransferase
LIRSFLLTLNAQHAVANLPFYLCDTQGRSWPMTWALLEEYRSLGLYDPKLHIMYHPDLDKDLVRFILDAIREGKSSYVFINTVTSCKALENIGIAREDAARLTVYGCYEVAAEGKEVPCTCGSYINMVKALELALNGGKDVLTGMPVGIEGGENTDFEALLENVSRQLTALLEKTMAVLSYHDTLLGPISPSPFISPTYEDSLTRGIELYAGGAKYNNTSVTGVGLATLVDSLLAIRTVVFEKKLVTLPELTDILKNNWEGQEKLRLLCRNSGPKYGNNLPEADGLARRLVDLAAGLVNGRTNGRGGVFRWGQFSVNIRSTFGEKTAATADGRFAGEALSKNAVASLGQDKRGVTALLSSVLQLDASRIPDGCVADVVLHSSAVKGEEGLRAFEGLLTTFMSAGGSIHFNVLSPEVLLQAQAEPEKYRNLQIRLCGWNVLFVNLNKREQDEFILQASREG